MPENKLPADGKQTPSQDNGVGNSTGPLLARALDPNAVPETSMLARVPTLASLANKDWRKLWMAGHLWHMAFWMDLIVLGLLVLNLTGSPFLSALIGTVRLLPVGILGFFAGSQADRFSKKKLLLLAQTINLSVTAVFFLLLISNALQIWHVFLAATLTGIAWAIDFPVRRAFIRDILPDRAVVNAMALDSASLNGSSMAGRWIAGSLIQLGQVAFISLAFGGAAAAYGVFVAFYTVGIIMLFSAPALAAQPRSVPGRASSPLRDLKEGLAYTWNNQALRGVFLVTILMNFLVFPYIQLTPVFAERVFHVGPAVLGLMSGMDGLGALVGTIILASAGGIRRRGAVFLLGATGLSLGILLFALSPSHLVAMPVLALSGLGIACFATMQTTIAVTEAAPAMRGRAMGAVALAIGMQPLGMAYIGFLAQTYGAQVAVAANAGVCLAAMVFLTVFLPGLRKAGAVGSAGAPVTDPYIRL